jgi:hypothetical protein
MIRLVHSALPVGPTGAVQPGHIFFDLAISKVTTPEELNELLDQFSQYALTEVWPDGWPTVSDLVLMLKN